MKVLCTGPESSGTRLLTRLVEGLGVEAIHRSIPHSCKWWDVPSDIDRVIYIVRDPWITEISAKEIGHPENGCWTGKDKEYPFRLIKAWEVFAENVVFSYTPWIPVTYEGLMKRPQWTLDNIADWLDVERKPLSERVIDPRENLGR